MKENTLPNPNIKTGEIGVLIAVKKRGSKVKYYTSKAKIKNGEFLLAQFFRTFVREAGINDLDLVKYKEENPQEKAMAEIQKIIQEEGRKIQIESNNTTNDNRTKQDKSQKK